MLIEHMQVKFYKKCLQCMNTYYKDMYQEATYIETKIKNRLLFIISY